MEEFLQQLINGLSLGAIYALIALGYTMIYGVLRFINFAHGDVFMVGTYIGFYVLTSSFGQSLGTGPLIVQVVRPSLIGQSPQALLRRRSRCQSSRRGRCRPVLQARVRDNSPSFSERLRGGSEPPPIVR